MTKEVKILLGEPKKAILKLSIPIIIGMLVQAVYNLADSIWLAGISSNALAAIGLFFPFFIIIMALGSGIGIGGGSAVSRKIGAGLKKDAENTALHTFAIASVVSILIYLLTFPFIGKIFNTLSGNGEVGSLAVDYAKILFGGTLVIVLVNAAGSILQGEGNAKKAMFSLIFGAGLNILLDPIFIYVFHWGVSGAALATLVAYIVSFFIFWYWLFLKKNIYLDLSFKNFNFNKKIVKEILWVGIPSTLARLSMAISMIFLNMIIIFVDSANGIAVFVSGWNILTFGTIPLVGIATGVTSVTGAAFGAKNKNKLKTAFMYAIKISFLTELIVACLIFIFAPSLAKIFSYSQASAGIYDDLVNFLRITSLFCLTVPFGMLTAAMFRGIGKGVSSLIATLLRVFIFQLLIVYLLAIYFGLGLIGVWWGIVIGNFIAVIITFVWGRLTINNLIMDNKNR